MKLKMTAPCHFGLEKILAFEIKRAGGEELVTTDGRVNFYGDESVLIKANISTSVAERIGVIIAEFQAETFDDIFDNIKNLSIDDFIERDGAFPVVKGQIISSKLTSLPAVQRTVKKALAVALEKKYNTTLPETGALYPVKFFLMKDHMTIYLDSSGDGLHKRGYRAASGAAPIKETLAAGLVDLARVRENTPVCDPLCGSGTILIESALKALNIPPSLNRNFAAEKWSFIDNSLFQKVRAEYKENIRSESDFTAYGYDIDENVIAIAKKNAEKAGVSKYITFRKAEVKNFKYPTKCKVITNPPYGERLMEKREAENVWKDMGKSLLPRGENEIYAIVGGENFEKYFGEKAAKNRKLYNGMMLCRYYMYI